MPERPPIDPESDPFAEGHEDQTPPEVYALRDGSAPDSPGWRVRVVPNLYPALAPGEPDPVADPLGGRRGEPDLFASRPARGAHELIVNSPKRGVVARRARARGGRDRDVRLARAHAGAPARPRTCT